MDIEDGNIELFEKEKETVTDFEDSPENPVNPRGSLSKTPLENRQISPETKSQQDIQQLISQYTTSGPFVDLCKCEIHDKLLKKDNELVIKEATTGYFDPQTGQETGNFVTYVIEFGENKTRKRYSDFELLAAHLNRVYPHQVIPPIPEKETLTSIISGYTGLKDKHDPFLIQHRTRLFQSFLMNIRNNPKLRGDHYFHRLIDSNLIGSAWSEGITAVPGKLGNEVGGGSVEGGKGGKIPDPLVLRLEEMTQKYRDGIRSIEKGQSKLLKRLKDESNVLSDLGASFNAFSLELADNSANQNEDDKNSTNQNYLSGTNEIDLDVPKWTNENEPGYQKLTNQNTETITNQMDSSKKFTNENYSFRSQLEMIGQSSDSEVIHLHSLIRHHELLRDKLQEMILFCACILKSLANLTLKRSNLEEFHDQINARKNGLMQMESNVRADDRQGEANENLKKLRKNIEELENIKKLKLSEMNEFSNQLLKDIDRIFAYFGQTWRESLRALAECQNHWHEEAIKSWKFCLNK